MTVVPLPELFTGKYDGLTPPLLLPFGAISDGRNMRKLSPRGGWKPRKGCELHNTTAAESGAEIKSLHQYTNPFSGDYHLIAQANSKLLYSTTDPPTAGTTFGTDLGVTVGTSPGFSTMIDECFLYADGSGRPVVWGGLTPQPIGVVVYDASETAYVDYTDEAIDGESTSVVTLGTAATDKIYVCGREKLTGVILNLTNVSDQTVTVTVKAWRSGAWAAVSDASDGTAVGGKTLAQDGTISWTASALDTMRIIASIQGYWYELSFSAAVTGGGTAVTINQVNVVMPASLMTNKWDGSWLFEANCLFFDQSVGKYEDRRGHVGNESTAQYADLALATTSDFVYIKTIEPAAAFGFGVVPGYENTANAQIDSLGYWNGNAWTEITTGLTDTTLDTGADSSFAQTGELHFNAAAISPVMRTWQSDNVPGYWYRVSWDAALGATCRIFSVQYAVQPLALGSYSGAIEWKGRLFLWGDVKYPNRLRYSALGILDCFSGVDSGYTDPFGNGEEILAVVHFYNELAVFKRKEIHLLEGYSPDTFGSLKISDQLGVASPKSVLTIERGFISEKRDPTNVLIWQDSDGVYYLDGKKPVRISEAVGRYFNPEFTECIAAASLDDLQAFPDYTNGEYHLLLPSAELIFNYVTYEWYPPWERALDLTTGISLIGTDNRFYTYGGTAGGFVCKLETDTSDKSAANADVTIEHYVVTRDIPGSVSGEQVIPFIDRTFRQFSLLAETSASGTVEITLYKNGVASGLDLSTVTNGIYFRFKIRANTTDLELELYGFQVMCDERSLLPGS